VRLRKGKVRLAASATVGARRRQVTLFLSSPGGMERERDWVVAEIRVLNRTLRRKKEPEIKLIRWPDDIAAGAGYYAQSVINRQATQLDIFLAVVGARMGTPTPRANSGTEEEFDRAIEEVYRGQNIQILLFFSNLPARIDQIDPYQLLMVKAFREKTGRLGVLHHPYSSLPEFRKRVRVSIEKAYRNILDGNLQRVRPLSQPPMPDKIVPIGSYQFTQTFAPQGAKIYPVPIAEFRGRKLRLTGRLSSKSTYFRFGFKYSDYREPPVSPGTVLTQGQNFLLHVGKNADSDLWLLAYYRAGIRLDLDRYLRRLDPAKPLDFALSIDPSGPIGLVLNGSSVFEGFFQVDGIPALSLMGWGDEHNFTCRASNLKLTVGQ